MFSRNPDILRGTLVIAGTRVPVRAVKSFADAGYSAQQIRAQYPGLTMEQIEAAMAAQADERAAMGVVEALNQVLDGCFWDGLLNPEPMRETILAAIDAAGYAVVPKKPTEEMLRVGAELVREFEPEFDSAEEYAAEIYKGMGEASPRPE